MKQIPSEYQECKAYAEWVRYHPNLLVVHHVNEGKRSAHEGKRLKSILLTPGLCDFQLFHANDNWHGLLIEMKRSDKKNHQMPANQVEFIQQLIQRKYYATFAFGCEEAIKITTDYLANKI